MAGLKNDHHSSPLSVSDYVELARFVLREALDPGGIYIPSEEVHHWLDALCDTAKKGPAWQATKTPWPDSSTAPHAAETSTE